MPHHARAPQLIVQHYTCHRTPVRQATLRGTRTMYSDKLDCLSPAVGEIAAETAITGALSWTRRLYTVYCSLKLWVKADTKPAAALEFPTATSVA